jgi:acyl carrier protein
VDSLGRMALLTALMDLTDQYIPDTAFSEGQTLGTIVEQAAAMAGPAA